MSQPSLEPPPVLTQIYIDHTVNFFLAFVSELGLPPMARGSTDWPGTLTHENAVAGFKIYRDSGTVDLWWGDDPDQTLEQLPLSLEKLVGWYRTVCEQMTPHDAALARADAVPTPCCPGPTTHQENLVRALRRCAADIRRGDEIPTISFVSQRDWDQIESMRDSEKEPSQFVKDAYARMKRTITRT